MILSILNYGCEVWGFHSCPDIERVHLKFLKQILKVKTQTSSASIYDELGRVPLIIKRKERILKYWLKVKFSSNTSLQHAYINEVNIMTLSNDNLHVSFWSLKVKTLLDELGFSYLFKHERTNNNIAGRPKAALLFWFFGDFRCGVPLFIVILVIYKYKNRKNIHVCVMSD